MSLLNRAYEKMNEYSLIKTIAMRNVSQSFQSQENISKHWRDLNYHGEPDYEKAVDEYDAFTAVIEKTGAKILKLCAMAPPSLDSIYVRDSLIVTPKGIVKAGMGKAQRSGEPIANADMLAAEGQKIIGKIKSPGQVEGGDLVWLDEKTLLAGIGYRTNMEGVLQLQILVGKEVCVHCFDMPHYKGKNDVFHLMSFLSPVDEKLAVVYLPLMPVRLVQFLEQRGFSFVHVPNDEFETMGCNVLAIAPSHVVMVAGNRETEKRLADAGCKVEIIKAEEISRKGEGGPTCLTRPLLRQ